ncbi:MAG: MerR family transcriptional regulator [Desulfonatronovibrionaceae bacterium]
MEKAREEKRYRIGDAARIVGVEPYVLRFWETEFPELVPERTAKGQRLYAEWHLELLKRIKRLLHEERVTIEGARIRLSEENKWAGLFREVKHKLQAMRDILER